MLVIYTVNVKLQQIQINSETDWQSRLAVQTVQLCCVMSVATATYVLDAKQGKATYSGKQLTARQTKTPDKLACCCRTHRDTGIHASDGVAWGEVASCSACWCRWRGRGHVGGVLAWPLANCPTCNRELRACTTKAPCIHPSIRLDHSTRKHLNSGPPSLVEVRQVPRILPS